MGLDAALRDGDVGLPGRVSALGAAVLLLAAYTSVPPARFDTSDTRTRLAVAMERERIGRFIELIAAAQPEVRLICFGEASPRWYWTGARSARYHRSIAEPLDGGIFNAALIVDDRGVIVAMLICNDFSSLRYRRATHGDSDIKPLLLPHATANLDPNGYMVAHADSGPGYFVYRVPIR